MEELIKGLREVAARAEQNGNIISIDYTDPRITHIGRDPLRIHVRDLRKLGVPLDNVTLGVLSDGQCMRTIQIAPGVEALDIIDDCELVATEAMANV